MTHSFDVGLAEKYGVEKAVLIGAIAHWVAYNKAAGSNFYNGKYWTYNTAEAFTRMMPYWSANKIQKMLIWAENEGILISDNFNDTKFNRTKWYSISDDFEYLLALYVKQPNGEIQSAGSSDGISQKSNSNQPNGEIQSAKQRNHIGINNTNSNSNTIQTQVQTQIQTPARETVKRDDEIFCLPSFLDPALWQSYLAYKKERMEKLTQKGIEMKFSEWARWASEGIDVNACIREAMANEWQGVFKPKPDKNGGGRNVPNNAATNPHGLNQGTLNTMRAFREFEAQLIASGQGHRVGGNYDDK